MTSASESISSPPPPPRAPSPFLPFSLYFLFLFPFFLSLAATCHFLSFFFSLPLAATNGWEYPFPHIPIIIPIYLSP
ncbi:hypothetical protein RchiOBHm_Chr7g0196361 [Rosa chinensis]|uniref:Uncharacterized protein n=1 Tax=Rosa chinensis TaxID=74649 RepID=A0A2P6P6K1_ROSCH|nr:hypothetical protein RchiOBHm_Chr7g0196361 [Rosa chinensis]